MLNTLKLTNFGCHEDLTVTFTTGLNVFRASNEAGKSTVIKAVAYALWGAKALPGSLADTVTWGKPLTSLKVELTFDVGGVGYCIRRSTAGAELTSDEALMVTGQTETAQYISSLLGASADVASSTLLATQKDIESALNADSGGLITKLANLDLIDKSVEAIRQTHPSGSTKLVTAQLETLVDLPAFEVDATLEEALDEAQQTMEKHSGVLQTLQVEMQQAKVREKAALQTMAKCEQVKIRRAQLQRALESSTQLPELPVEPAPLAEAEAARDVAVHHQQRVEAYKVFAAFDNSLCAPVEEKPDLPTLRNLLLSTQVELQTMKLELEQETKDGKLCGFCGKDLGDMPSVKLAIERKKTLPALIEKQSLNVLELSTQIASAEAAQALNQHVSGMQNVTLDTDFWPAKPLWVGDVPSEKNDLPTTTEALSKLRQQHAQYSKAVAAYHQAVEYRKQVEEALQALEVVDIGEAKAVLEQVEHTAALLENAASNHYACQIEVVRLKRELDLQQQRAEFTKTTNAANAVKRNELNQALEQMHVVNSLLTKLRDCRPVVTNKLWSLLTETVSAHFSQMRGVPSLVTRADTKGFLVDGKNAQVFSGSTQDVLALALRQTLVKVFLPCVDFIILDEPAAGCDAERETALIAAVSKAGFNQVLLVTHSSLADSFASNLITLD
jgi:DNA repair exonuclease SbcCD ATPase subunit